MASEDRVAYELCKSFTEQLLGFFFLFPPPAPTSSSSSAAAALLSSPGALQSAAASKGVAVPPPSPITTASNASHNSTTIHTTAVVMGGGVESSARLTTLPLAPSTTTTTTTTNTTPRLTNHIHGSQNDRVVFLRALLRVFEHYHYVALPHKDSHSVMGKRKSSKRQRCAGLPVPAAPQGQPPPETEEEGEVGKDTSPSTRRLRRQAALFTSSSSTSASFSSMMPGGDLTNNPVTRQQSGSEVPNDDDDDDDDDAHDAAAALERKKRLRGQQQKQQQAQQQQPTRQRDSSRADLPKRSVESPLRQTLQRAVRIVLHESITLYRQLRTTSQASGAGSMRVTISSGHANNNRTMMMMSGSGDAQLDALKCVVLVLGLEFPGYWTLLKQRFSILYSRHPKLRCVRPSSSSMTSTATDSTPASDTTANRVVYIQLSIAEADREWTRFQSVYGRARGATPSHHSAPSHTMLSSSAGPFPLSTSSTTKKHTEHDTNDDGEAVNAIEGSSLNQKQRRPLKVVKNEEEEAKWKKCLTAEGPFALVLSAATVFALMTPEEQSRFPSLCVPPSVAIGPSSASSFSHRGDGLDGDPLREAQLPLWKRSEAAQAETLRRAATLAAQLEAGVHWPFTASASVTASAAGGGGVGLHGEKSEEDATNRAEHKGRTGGGGGGSGDDDDDDGGYYYSSAKAPALVDDDEELTALHAWWKGLYGGGAPTTMTSAASTRHQAPPGTRRKRKRGAGEGSEEGENPANGMTERNGRSEEEEKEEGEEQQQQQQEEEDLTGPRGNPTTSSSSSASPFQRFSSSLFANNTSSFSATGGGGGGGEALLRRVEEPQHALALVSQLYWVATAVRREKARALLLYPSYFFLERVNSASSTRRVPLTRQAHTPASRRRRTAAAAASAWCDVLPPSHWLSSQNLYSDSPAAERRAANDEDGMSMLQRIKVLQLGTPVVASGSAVLHPSPPASSPPQHWWSPGVMQAHLFDPRRSVLGGGGGRRRQAGLGAAAGLTEDGLLTPLPPSLLTGSFLYHRLWISGLWLLLYAKVVLPLWWTTVKRRTGRTQEETVTVTQQAAEADAARLAWLLQAFSPELLSSAVAVLQQAFGFHKLSCPVCDGAIQGPQGVGGTLSAAAAGGGGGASVSATAGNRRGGSSLHRLRWTALQESQMELHRALEGYTAVVDGDDNTDDRAGTAALLPPPPPSSLSSPSCCSSLSLAKTTTTLTPPRSHSHSHSPRLFSSSFLFEMAFREEATGAMAEPLSRAEGGLGSQSATTTTTMANKDGLLFIPSLRREVTQRCEWWAALVSWASSSLPLSSLPSVVHQRQQVPRRSAHRRERDAVEERQKEVEEESGVRSHCPERSTPPPSSPPPASRPNLGRPTSTTTSSLPTTTITTTTTATALRQAREFAECLSLRCQGLLHLVECGLVVAPGPASAPASSMTTTTISSSTGPGVPNPHSSFHPSSPSSTTTTSATTTNNNKTATTTATAKAGFSDARKGCFEFLQGLPLLDLLEEVLLDRLPLDHCANWLVSAATGTTFANSSITTPAMVVAETLAEKTDAAATPTTPTTTSSLTHTPLAAPPPPSQDQADSSSASSCPDAAALQGQQEQLLDLLSSLMVFPLPAEPPSHHPHPHPRARARQGTRQKHPSSRGEPLPQKQPRGRCRGRDCDHDDDNHNDDDDDEVAEEEDLMGLSSATPRHTGATAKRTAVMEEVSSPMANNSNNIIIGHHHHRPTAAAQGFSGGGCFPFLSPAHGVLECSGCFSLFHQYCVAPPQRDLFQSRTSFLRPGAGGESSEVIHPRSACSIGTASFLCHTCRLEVTTQNSAMTMIPRRRRHAHSREQRRRMEAAGSVCPHSPSDETEGRNRGRSRAQASDRFVAFDTESGDDDAEEEWRTLGLGLDLVPEVEENSDEGVSE